MEPEEGADSNDGAASAEEIIHWGDQEKEASKDRLTPRYIVEKMSETTSFQGWYYIPFKFKGPAWVFLLLALMMALLALLGI
jgi:hypothetical protein